MSASQIRLVSGRAVVLSGADIDTDRIIPARFLKTVTFDGLERGLFADDRQALRDRGECHPFDAPDAPGASILIVSENFGCGSSREHAPQALFRWGIRAIVGVSFAEIFFSNSVMLGLPCVSLQPADVKALMQAIASQPTREVLVDLVGDRVTTGDFTWTTVMPPHAKQALTSGHWDGAGLLLDHYEEVEQFESSLPYLTVGRSR